MAASETMLASQREGSEAIGVKDAATMSSEAADAAHLAQGKLSDATPASSPSLLQERRGLHVAALCCAIGLYTSRGTELSEGDTAHWDAGIAATWFGSPPRWLTLFIVSMLLWALRESTMFPRHASMASARDKARLLMQFAGDAILTPVFLFLPGEKTEVRFAPTPLNERLVAACPRLQRFKQTPWFRNAFSSFGWLLVHDYLGAADNGEVQREVLSTPDGAALALDWWGGKPEPGTIEKVLFLGTTWSGDALVSFQRNVCTHFTSRGWKCVVIVKRGCGLTMPNEQPPLEGKRAAPWCLDGFDDIDLAVDHVARTLPGVPICGLAPSLGGAQLRNYVRKLGARSKLTAAVVVDSAECWVESVPSIDGRMPLLSKALRGAAEVTLDLCGVPEKYGEAGTAQETSASVGKKAADGYMASLFLSLAKDLLASLVAKPTEEEGDISEFLRNRLAPAHGFEASPEGVSSYLRSCQPADPVGLRVPTLELVTFNDMLIDPPSVRSLQNMYLASPHIITCATRGGTHAVRWNGCQASCWISQTGCDFFEAVLQARADGLTSGPD